MPPIASAVDSVIGNTPLVRLNRISRDMGATVVLKLESRNPGGSVKDRIGLAMIDDAEERGIITRGSSVLVEPTSGNTGIALAMIGAARGYRTILTMPESMSLERRKLLEAFGAEIVLTASETGMRGSVEAAETIAAETPGAWIPAQFDNPANPRAHYRTTGPEVWDASGACVGSIGAFIAGVGTGGTVSGTSLYLKEQDDGVLAFAVEPAESPIITQKLAGDTLTPGPHTIQGIGANFIPGTLDLGVLDGVETVTGDEAIAMARRLAAEEGLFVGISSGANVAAALRIAQRSDMSGKLVVTIAPDTGERYLSTSLWKGLG
jgi:cysteine synthase A